MSMLGSIYRISQSDIEAIHRDPVCVGGLLDWPEPPMDTKPGFFERLFLGKRPPRQVPSKRVPELATLPKQGNGILVEIHSMAYKRARQSENQVFRLLFRLQL